MDTAIIFGITGQDGSHLVDLLLKKNYSVIGVSRYSSTDNTGRIKHVLSNENFKLVQGDITDVFSVSGILKEYVHVDEIYNLAAQSHVGVSFKQPGLTWDITGKGCLNILQSIVDLDMLGCRFYQASSSEMFGDSSDIYENGQRYQNENTKFLPQSPYAIAKCAAHYATRLFREAYGLHASAGILFNHEGPRRGENFVTRKITVAVSKIMFGVQDLLSVGNLDAKRDWGYAPEYCEGMWKMLQVEKPDDYVIATGETHTVREFIEESFDVLGEEIIWEGEGIDEKGILKSSGQMVVNINPRYFRPTEVELLIGDASKAKTNLGWTPKVTFKELVKIMVTADYNKQKERHEKK